MRTKLAEQFRQRRFPRQEKETHFRSAANMIMAVGTSLSHCVGPGDMINTAVSNGGTINIRSASEAMHLPLTQHAWTVIRHPTQANLQAARHNIDAFVQIEIESVTGTVWHHQRRRRAATRYRDPTTTTETAEQNASAADGSCGQRRPSGEANPRTPCTTSASTLGGSLQHMSHVQWESALNAPVVDNNPLVANIAREAAGETLSSFGAGASTDMIQALATWLASHVRNRRATRAYGFPPLGLDGPMGPLGT